MEIAKSENIRNSPYIRSRSGAFHRQSFLGNPRICIQLFSIWKAAPQTMARIGGSPAKVRTALALALPL